MNAFDPLTNGAVLFAVSCHLRSVQVGRRVAMPDARRVNQVETEPRGEY